MIRAVKMPKNGDKNHNIDFIPTLKRIFKIPHYREGVIAQFFYVGAQIMCWTFVINMERACLCRREWRRRLLKCFPRNII